MYKRKKSNISSRINEPIKSPVGMIEKNPLVNNMPFNKKKKHN